MSHRNCGFFFRIVSWWRKCFSRWTHYILRSVSIFSIPLSIHFFYFLHSHDSIELLLGEIICWSLSGLKGPWTNFHPNQWLNCEPRWKVNFKCDDHNKTLYLKEYWIFTGILQNTRVEQEYISWFSRFYAI